jgi:hypothetical protein
LKKQNENTSNWIKGLEINYVRNKNEINKQLVKIWFESLLNTELVTWSLLDESKRSLENEARLNNELKELSSNSIKKALNATKIEKLKKEIIKIKKKIVSIETIIKLIKENIWIKNKIDKYNEKNKKINITAQGININNEELEIIKNKINQIKDWLINIFIKQ